ncbi:magnesium and cobalt transport protein CorA [Nitrosopumilus cobalaminigenes]|uniref:Magnesium transport protein CorA n=1 Tax=Nitrosopumilus cobalaminigenes TaxID=1470066 RepID=A0A7D5QXY5_9ARCH|nr:magnesium/cobalt transporter CorA [Nitrosopumilus cobalaminigenes]QLH03356.1 magnesium and cobalt transport protein CorA [Nitrosopumilus cobalaminigenes]
MRDTVGIVINRLVYGFTFAFLYQIVIGIATSLLSLPLTGNIQDLISGVEQIESQQGPWLVVWWILSTIIITVMALLIIRYKKYLSPYKGEKNIEIPPKITAVTAIIIGASISFLFFLLDTIIGLIVQTGSKTDVSAIYQAAIIGDFTPLIVSIIFSIIAGFIIVGVASKTSKVKEITDDLGLQNIAGIMGIRNKTKTQKTTISDTIGQRPGALIHVGEQKVDNVTVNLIEYDSEKINEITNASFEECLESKNKPNVSWVNIIGVHDPNVIKTFGDNFGIHSLHQSNIMNTELRPSVEIFDDHILIMLKMPHYDSQTGKLDLEQISIVLAENHLLTFQEIEDDFFDEIRKRLRDNAGSIRKLKSDYLAYSLIDAIIDSYFLVLEKIGDLTEDLEEVLMQNPTPETMQTIQTLKRRMIALRKAIWPGREIINSLERESTVLISDNTRTYLRDVYNHTIQVTDSIEGLRDVIGGMLDTYLSSVSNRMNEVMKTLTIVAAIFIPITFIAGLYGTNFSYVPELEWEGSYFAMLIVMAIISGAMVAWFKKKRWL